MKLESRLGALSAALSAAALGVSLYILSRVRSIQAQVQRIEHLSHRIDRLNDRIEATADHQAARAPRPTAAPLSAAVVSRGTSAANESSLPVSRSSSIAGSNDDAGDGSGYKTADEDADGEDSAAAVDRPPPISSSPAAAIRRPSAVRQPPLSPAMPAPITHSNAEREFMDAAEGSPGPVHVDPPNWAAQSIIAEGGSWSCIDGAPMARGTSASENLLGAPLATNASEAAAAKAAEVAMCAKADELYEKREFSTAAELLDGCEQSIQVLWRRCRLNKELGEAAKLAGEADKCKKLLYEGLEMVTHALNDIAGGAESWEVHKWYAIAVSQTSGYEGTKATITKSLVVKEHFSRAAELNPLDATTRHALGMWYWEVASLSWAMRKIAAAVFASPPTGTYDEALSHFQLAEGITPGFYLRNRLMIAKCQLNLRDKPSAKKWAQLATELPVLNHDDETAAAEATQILASL